jgi:hypothetical protein
MPLMRVKDAARELGLSRNSVLALIANGELQQFRIPTINGAAKRSTIRLDSADIEKLKLRWRSSAGEQHDDAPAPREQARAAGPARRQRSRRPSKLIHFE